MTFWGADGIPFGTADRTLASSAPYPSVAGYHRISHVIRPAQASERAFWPMTDSSYK